MAEDVRGDGNRRHARWVLLFSRSLRALARRARERIENDGWLEVALGASISSFALGMWFYDAFSFVQVTVILFVLFALSVVLVRSEEAAPEDAAKPIRL